MGGIDRRDPRDGRDQGATHPVVASTIEQEASQEDDGTFDAFATLSDIRSVDFDPMPAPVPVADPIVVPGRRPMVHPGGPAPARTAMVSRPAVAPIPTEEFLRVIRDARKLKINAAAEANPALAGSVPTRTPETVDAYRARGNQLLKRYHRMTRAAIDAHSFDPMDFAFWLLSLRQGLKAPSWRLYRQSAIMLLSGFPTDEANAAIELIENDAPGERMMDTGDPIPDGTIPADKRMTSARKRKHFAYDEWLRIEAHVKLHNRSDNSMLMLDWIGAGIATGLRPSEWKATQILRHHIGGEERIFLLVSNAKATNGRGNGAVRTIEITTFSRGMIEAVQRMSDMGIKALQDGSFERLQSACAQILYQVGLKLWPRRQNQYSLYSCRHQFIANMKALGMSNEEVSALAGHVVDETAAQTYGRKRMGWPEDKIIERPSGVKEEIATVRKRLVIWEARQELVTIAKHGPRGLPQPEPVAPLPAPGPTEAEIAGSRGI